MPAVAASSILDSLRQSPVHLFAVLDKAVERGDFLAAAEAQKRLRDIGIDVQYGRTKPSKSGKQPTEAVPR